MLFHRRGKRAEHLLASLLRRAGLTVTPLGIEETVRGIRQLSGEEYAALSLPLALRAMPDFLVAAPRFRWAKLVEVKYRTSWSDATARELHTLLETQRRMWPESFAVILLGNPIMPDGQFHQDVARVVRPGETESLLWRPSPSPESEAAALRAAWERLPTLFDLLRSPSDGSETAWSPEARALASTADEFVSSFRQLVTYI